MTLNEVPMETPPVKRRKPHKKSRTGCLDCRKRRVKCSEERPSCRSCVRREVFCEYPEEAQPTGNLTPQSSDLHDDASPARLSPRVYDTGGDHNRTQHPSTPAPTPVGAASSVSRRPGASTDTFGIRDLALLHHWTVSTSVSIFKAPDLDSLWQVLIPQIAFEHPFVTHAILSLAALHMAYLDDRPQNSSYVEEATQHHAVSLAGFHSVLENCTVDQYEGLFLWSILNIIYVFSISKQLADNVERNSPRLRKDRLLGVEWIPMMRGIDAVLAPYYDFLRGGRMQPLLSLGNWTELEPGDSILDPMDRELRRLQDIWKDSGDADVYNHALTVMRKARMYCLQFETMEAHMLADFGWNRALAGPLSFVHFGPQQYFTLLHQRQPPALVLFTYLGALLHSLNHVWFFEGWGKDIVEAIDDLLGDYWRPWIRWPLRHAGLSSD
ncbi:Putative zn(2)Cys(6) fungal-type DNA-binding domain-containing protein [Colletotrichum destructivum]|uniref:Zn(2)Cys(6) fungal-type DNA-binding domain-containing protein n=1 Tax=Colletotrichum destructivum TaxID=34406 RepID=A0AAX4IRK5_9PEZI|nr:Putative zn(2)Cys(6) fungal-type DNA-binding domain-containing protein [Colletotrichum destructivum]